MSSPTLALIPAKHHSVGVPDKNWKPITPDGRNCVDLAVQVASAALDPLSLRETVSVISSDTDLNTGVLEMCRARAISRPMDLPDTMLAVVQDALTQVPGPDDEIIVLLQPSSPLRTPETVRRAIQMLEEADDDTHSVVSVSPTYPRDWTLTVEGDGILVGYEGMSLGELPTRRQGCRPAWKRDGVVYAFRRSAISEYGDIYGWRPKPLYTPPSEALSIDTPEDWDEAVRRLALVSAGSGVGASR